MTTVERRNPDILKNSRKKRIAAGSGTRAEDINRLLKQHRQMADMMKMMGGAGGKKGGALGKMASMFGMGGNPLAGMPAPTPEQLEEMGRKLGAGQNPGLPSMPDFGKMPKLPPNLPGLGGGRLPGLGGGGFPFGGKKK